MSRPRKSTLVTLALLAIGAAPAFVSCAAASGYDPNAHGRAGRAVDPDTEALAPTAKETIPDPRRPLAPGSAAPETTDTATTSPSGADDAGVAAGDASPAPKTTVATAKAATPKPPAPAPAADCGSKENPCPMQKLMRTQMVSASTPEALAAAFTRVAGLSPNGGWAWGQIAKKGVELAKSGDTKGAKAQCKACHDQYKDAYKKQYRARKF